MAETPEEKRPMLGGPAGDPNFNRQPARRIMPRIGGTRVNQRFWGDGQHSRAEDQVRSMVRPSSSLRAMGGFASGGYDTTHQAMASLHEQGVQGLHHHGRKMQEFIKSMAQSGAHPHELKDLRTHLSGLSGALAAGDKVKAHQSLLGLQQSFYSAHAGYEKEHGPGPQFPQHRFNPQGGMSAHESALQRQFAEQDQQRPRWGGKRGGQMTGDPEGTEKAISQHPPALRPGSTLNTGSHEIQAHEREPKKFAAETHADVLKRHGYNRRGTGEYVHPETKHSAIVQIGGISHHSPSGKHLGHFPTAKALDQHLAKVHSAGGDDSNDFRARSWDHTIHFRSDEFNSLPQKPGPEDFTRAIGAAQNIKADKWDHRFINHEDLCPSEEKDPDDKLIKLMQSDPLKVPPIVVRANDKGKYDILDGHHRYAASKKAGGKGMWAACVLKGSYA